MYIKQTFDSQIKKLGLGWFMVLSFWAPPTWAQGLFEDALGESKQPGKEASGSDQDFFSVSKLDFSGFIRGDLYVGKVPDRERTEVKNGYAEVAGKLRVGMGEWGDAACEFRLRHGYDGAEVQSDLSLREAYVDVYLGRLDLRFGEQIIAWGRADGINPTDNLTPRDLRVRSPDEDDRRASNLALRLNYHLSPARAELVYVPFYAPAYFPVFQLPGPVGLADPDYPDTRMEHGILATRLHVELAAVDFSVSYLFGYSTFPGLGLAQFDPSPTDPQLALQFRAYQHHVVGADFATALGELVGLRGEAALRWPIERDNSEHVPLPEIQYVLGMDREFGDLSVIAQYVGKTVLDWERLDPTGLLDLAQGKEIPPEQLQKILQDPQNAARIEVERKTRMISGQTVRWSHAMTLRLQYKWLQETLSFEIMGMANFSTQEWMLRSKLSYAIADGLLASLGAELFGGPDDTLYGTIDQSMSAGFLELKAFF